MLKLLIKTKKSYLNERVLVSIRIFITKHFKNVKNSEFSVQNSKFFLGF